MPCCLSVTSCHRGFASSGPRAWPPREACSDLCSQTPSPAHVHRARLCLARAQVWPRHLGAAAGVACGRAGQTPSWHGSASHAAPAPGARDEALLQARPRGPATPLCRGPAAGLRPCVPCPRSGLSHRGTPARPGTSLQQAPAQVALARSPHSACRPPCVLRARRLPARTVTSREIAEDPGLGKSGLLSRESHFPPSESLRRRLHQSTHLSWKVA